MRNSLSAEATRAAHILQKFLKPVGPEEPRIPKEVFQKAKGIAVLKTFTAGCMTSVMSGSGIVVGRLASGYWSAPSGIRIAGMGVGGMIGVEVCEIVIVINTKEAMKEFFKAKVNLGGSVKVAAGPTKTKSAKDKIFAPVYTYIGKKGIFAGFSLEGQMLLERKDCNKEFFGRAVTAEELLTSKIANLSEIENLYAVLDEQLQDEDGNMVIDYQANYDMSGNKSIEIGEHCKRGFGVFNLYIEELRLDSFNVEEISSVFIVLEHKGRIILETPINTITWTAQNNAFVEWVMRSFSKEKVMFAVIDFNTETNVKTLLGFSKLDLSSQLPPGIPSGSGVQNANIPLKGWVTSSVDKAFFSKMKIKYFTASDKKKVGMGEDGQGSPNSKRKENTSSNLRKSMINVGPKSERSSVIGMVRANMIFRPVDQLTDLRGTSSSTDVADGDELLDDFQPLLKPEHIIFPLQSRSTENLQQNIDEDEPLVDADIHGLRKQSLNREKMRKFKNERTTISIVIEEAKDLFANDWGGTSDPYVRVIFNGEKIYKTKVVKKTLAPVWKEKVLIPMANKSRDKVLIVMKDWNLATKAATIGKSFNYVRVSYVHSMLTFEYYSQVCVRLN